jgi:iron complex outermembrane recepter protein
MAVEDADLYACYRRLESPVFNVLYRWLWQRDECTPKDKLILNGLYAIGSWAFNGTLTRYGSFVSVNSTNPALDQTFGAKWLFDLSVDYTLDRWTFTLGGDNVFNEYPDKTIAANNNNGALPYSVFSRFGFNGAYV